MHGIPFRGYDRERFMRSLFLFLSGWLFCAAGRGEDAADPCNAKLKELRKLSFLALAIPAGVKESPEQRKFLLAVDRFLKQVPAGHETAKAPAYYVRGRYFLQRKNSLASRADFDAALRAPDAGGVAASVTHDIAWFPTLSTIRVLRAITFLGDGVGAVLEKLEEIPADASPPTYHEVGDLLNRWAEELGNKEQFDEAIRAYGVIQRLHLWEDEGDDPSRRVELLKVQRDGRRHSP